MTKKHFIAMAAIFKNHRIRINSIGGDFKYHYLQIIKDVETDLIKMFIEENPNFDIDKFIEASNLTKEEMELPL